MSNTFRTKWKFVTYSFLKCIAMLLPYTLVRGIVPRLNDKIYKYKSADDSLGSPLQRSHATSANRYPKIFAVLSELLRKDGGEGKTILSFGCSTGEECFTLAEQYFTGSTIVGVDRSDECIETCKSKLPGQNIRDNRVEFMNSDELGQNREFDAVFALSVLCRHPFGEKAKALADVFPFAQFNNALKKLDSLVREGGYLVIINSSYNFEDSETAGNYATVNMEGMEGIFVENNFVPRHDRNGNPIPMPVSNGMIFQKNGR